MEPLPLPEGVRSSYVDGVNGLRMHLLSAGRPSDPLLLLLHGFPELAFSWRHVLAPLGSAGYHVVAPDQRGYGRTVPPGQRYSFEQDDDLVEFRSLNRVADMVALVSALGYAQCDIVGHDFGSSFAFWCAMTRPDVFRSLVMMSAPTHAQPAPPPSGPTPSRPDPRRAMGVHQDLRALRREHYQRHYSLPSANAELLSSDLPAFFRAYYHVKSADWAPNAAHVSHSMPERWSAVELSKLPTYLLRGIYIFMYIVRILQCAPVLDARTYGIFIPRSRYYVMEAGATMPETVAAHWDSDDPQVRRLQ
jgi:pimeloyl-ACP methyl ester carboxylesterase|eukprot:COSAG06_NODE_3032_length_5939_cov_4.174114_8_plen_305_part_00